MYMSCSDRSKISSSHTSRRAVSKEAGFSLLELLVVIIVVGIIAAITVARFQAAIKASNEASAASAVRLIVNVEVTKKYTGNVATFDQLITENSIDSVFQDGDGDPNTAARNGYRYLLTVSGTDFVISAKPATVGLMTGTGTHRFGSDQSAALFWDSENLDTHYTTSAELRSGTSIAYEP